MTRPLPAPEAVWVGPIRYTIEYRKPGKMPDREQMGQTREIDASIWVNTATSDATLRATVWHEILHAIANVYGPHRGEMTETYRLGNERRQMVIEEMYVGFYEPGILAFVRDNPDAWAWILGH